MHHKFKRDFSGRTATCYDYLGITYDGKDGDYLFKASQDFTSPTPEANMMTAIGAWVQGGLAPKSAAYDYMRRYSLIDPELKDADIDGLIDSELPSAVANAFKE